MLQEHVGAVLARLSFTDLVLDVGGWSCPFNRAQWVLDIEPYETRGFYRTLGAPPRAQGASSRVPVGERKRARADGSRSREGDGPRLPEGDGPRLPERMRGANRAGHGGGR